MDGPGLFVSVEGIDKAGKSTVIAELTARIESLSPVPPELVTCREPGGTAFGERIREALLQPGLPPHPEAEMLAFAAARAQLVHTIIIPALRRGAVVICDRYIDSTIAYQHYGRGLSIVVISAVHAAAVRGPMPDITLLLDHDPDAARERGLGADDYIESEAAAFHTRVRNGYLEMAAAEPDRWRVLDASQPAVAVIAQAWGHVRAALGLSPQ